MAEWVAGKRPKLARATDEAKRLAALLGGELLRWPDVSARPMFGVRAFRRGDVMFAMLPSTYAIESPNAIAYKLPEGEKKWQLFELRESRDVDKALACLNEAYKQAAKKQ